jgi:hypothetical protein
MRGKKMKGPSSVDAFPAEKMGGRSMPPASGPKMGKRKSEGFKDDVRRPKKGKR